MLKQVTPQTGWARPEATRPIYQTTRAQAEASGSLAAMFSTGIDSVSFAAKDFSIKKAGNTLRIVSFRGIPDVPQYAFKTYLTDTRDYIKNIRRLDRVNWQNDTPLTLSVEDTGKDGGRKVYVQHPKYGTLGKLPSRVGNYIALLMKKGHSFSAELSDIDGAKAPNSPYILRVNVKYNLPEGRPLQDVPDDINRAVKHLLKAKSTRDKVSLYQPPVSPEKVMGLLAPQETVSTILNEIGKAKKILLVGHTSPDGDTIGCVLAMNAVLKHLDKEPTCCIDDSLDGMYRHKLPGIDEHLKKASEIDPSERYDLAIIMDSNTPARLGKAGDHIKNAGKVIFIDHHTLVEERWRESLPKTGIDVDRIKKDHLMWINDKMPATAEMIAGLIFNMFPQTERDSFSSGLKQAIAKPLAAAIKTDTECFHKGEGQQAESVAKYLMDWGGFGKKWLRDTIEYHLPKSARRKVEKYARQGLTVESDIAYASIQVPYAKFMDVFKTAQKFDPDVIKADVANEFLYTNVFQNIRRNPRTHNDDRIAALIMQRMQKEVEGKDYISVNIRSGNGSGYAKKIARELGGGGHPTMAAVQVYTHQLKDKIYDAEGSAGEKVDLERKIAQLARKFRQEEKDKTVG